MKKITTILLMGILSVSLSFGQTATQKEVENKTKKGKLTSYITSNGEKFSVGDEITLGNPADKDFRNVKQNAGMGTYYPLTSLSGGSTVTIKKINAYSRVVSVNTTKPSGVAFGLIILNFENAISVGEIQTSIMTSDDALEELKKCKDKLDLGLITQEEFDAKKEELAKFIK